MTTLAAVTAPPEYPVSRIHPDPVQPRLHPDAELAEAIRSEGVLQAIRIEPLQELDAICEDCGKTFADLHAESGHYMIQDGERRWRGAVAAKLATIPVRIVPVATEAERLVRQLVANTGKPLSPVEEAFAYLRIMEAEKITQVEMAKRLGKPRSLVGDRVRLASLHQAWLDLIQSGLVQPSHAAILSGYSAVPDEYQAKAAAAFADDWNVKQFAGRGEAIPTFEFQKAVISVYRDYLCPVGDVRGYKGPVVEVMRATHDSRKVKMAADIKLWRPIRNKVKSAETKRMRQHNGSSSYGAEKQRVHALEQLGLPVVKQKGYNVEVPDGAVVVYQYNGWQLNVDPEIFLARVDRASLTVLSAGSTPAVVTTDAQTVAAAQEAYSAGLLKHLTPEINRVRKTLTSEMLAGYEMQGPGCRCALHQLAERNSFDSGPTLLFLSHVLGIGGREKVSDGSHASVMSWLSELPPVSVEKLLAAYLVVLDAAPENAEVEWWADPERLVESYDSKIDRHPFRFDDPKGKKAKEKQKAVKS